MGSPQMPSFITFTANVQENFASGSIEKLSLLSCYKSKFCKKAKAFGTHRKGTLTEKAFNSVRVLLLLIHVSFLLHGLLVQQLAGANDLKVQRAGSAPSLCKNDGVTLPANVRQLERTRNENRFAGRRFVKYRQAFKGE